MVKKKGWVSLQFKRMDLEDKVKEEINQKRLNINKYQREYYQRPIPKAKRKEYYSNKGKQYNKEYYLRRKKENNSIDYQISQQLLVRS